MPGQIILSRRLERMQQAMRDFGDTYAEVGEQQRKRKLEDEDRASMAKSRAIQDRAATAQAGAAELTLGRFREQDAARESAFRDSEMLETFGQAVPENDITRDLGSFAPMQHRRPPSDPSADRLKDRLRASMHNSFLKAEGKTEGWKTPSDFAKEREAQLLQDEETRANLKYKGALTNQAQASADWTQRRGLGGEKEGGPSPREKQTQHTNIRNARKDFEDNDFVKMIPKTDRYFSSADKAWARYQGAGPDDKESARQFTDQALVYSFNKLMEETSAVMPGEFERTAMGQSVASDVMNKIRQGLGGGLKLDDNQRGAMIETMRIFRDNVIDNAEPVFKQYVREAEILSPEDPDRIVGGFRRYFEGDRGGAQNGGAGLKPERSDNSLARPNSSGTSVTGARRAAGLSPAAEGSGSGKHAFPEQVKARALQALKDPEATPEEKAAAERILMGR